jgi:hypothetical protein
MIDDITYYNPETYLFPHLARNFADTGTIDPEALYLILDWKAPRARTRHLSRLTRIAKGGFAVATSMIAAELHAATDPEQQLNLLLSKWEFRLPTATAILSILYPETFTVYDIRVCDTLGAFHELGSIKWSPAAWQKYRLYIAAVRDKAPNGRSLRDCDRWLWGQNKRKALLKELADQGQAPAD